MNCGNFNAPGLAVILASAFTSGCIVNERAIYGVDWADKVRLESEECPVIDGEFQNAGERFESGTYARQAVSLAHLFNGGSEKWHNEPNRLGRTAFDPTEDEYRTVSLRLADSNLHIEAMREDGGTQAFDLPTRHECRDSTLILESDWGDSETMLMASAVGRSTVALGRAEDGSLLVRESQTGVGFVLWLPVVAGKFSEWTRFSPAMPAAEEKSAQLSETTL
jgi:hypothetical protein